MLIEAQDLTKIYKMGAVEVHALRGVDFSVGKGEFVGITGSSGSGKSTLLHLVGLLDDATSGSLEIGGVDVSGLTDHEKTEFRLKRFGYVFQDYALVSELNAVENVYLPSLARGEDKERAEKSALAMLNTVGIGERSDHLPSELSGGEQQRVSIARALINSPEIMFADEPCANLDSVNSGNVLDLFRKVSEESGQTILMVSHEEWHAEYFERIIRLHDGAIAEDKYL
ncbi:ABC transporter ATP-binding protein [Methanoplanus endosymbiosus]|uniref:ABC transporter ATP-binding protein n=1 Tax=Methanoplanus endosymbiosus TaxID=33865 RepID=A0A9E7TMT9_9EURY|nr:ABC transporter ATP-binding protein [Methanoplanus endosymbiosus]UUX93676.1 ABC transporter ATP-binding protein [Methanoplanus endosymbiosus]